jgi:hypothetical protein
MFNTYRVCGNALAATLIAFFVTTSGTARAGVLNGSLDYYPDEFYTKVDSGLRNKELKIELFNILTEGHLKTQGHDQLKEKCPVNLDAATPAAKPACYNVISVGYNKARQIMFGEIHLVKTDDGYGVYDVYCGQLKTKKDFGSKPPGPDQIPDSKVLNAEHTWPQSQFSGAFDKNVQKSDMHILYPVDSGANSSRGNLKFGDVVTIMDQPCAASKRGYSARGTGEIYFEPPAVHKGNVARALFYFSVRYKIAIPADEEASLRAWNKLDPVDDQERKRNDEIFAAQKDRNPFIDHPELADLISDF